jgi:hypothetical protein
MLDIMHLRSSTARDELDTSGISHTRGGSNGSLVLGLNVDDCNVVKRCEEVHHRDNVFDEGDNAARQCDRLDHGVLVASDRLEIH